MIARCVTEVKPVDAGWYYVELRQLIKQDVEDPDYFKDWYEYDGTNWVLDIPAKVVVTEIFKKEK